MSIDEKAFHTAYDAYHFAYTSDVPVSEMKAVRLRAFLEAYQSATSSQQPVERTSITEHPQWPSVAKEQWEAEQVLGKALGYPWYKDDKKNFPDATEADGVCTGEHTFVTLAMEAATRMKREFKPLTDEEAGEVVDLLLKGSEGQEDLTDCMTFGLSKVLEKYNIRRRGLDD